MDELAQDEGLIREFLTESNELLQALDRDLVQLEIAPGDPELLNRAFRALHTIKGTSSFLGFAQLVEVSHGTEDVLNALRKGELVLTRPVMDVLLSATDMVRAFLLDVQNHELKPRDISSLLEALRRAKTSAVAPCVRGDDALRPEDVPGAVHGEACPAQERVPVAEAARKEIAQDLVSATMRVEVDKLDALVNLVGELVLERNRIACISRDVSMNALDLEQIRTSLAESGARLSQVTDELQTVALNTRMVPIDTLFRKFPRIVRDVARQLGKQVELVISGQETELDRTIIERITDPMVHLVRNALDHGLEMPEVRIRCGKSPVGTIRLQARQQGDHIVISIADDGAGINTERVLRKATEKGLVSAEAAAGLSQREIVDMIFLPGFSTAERVTDMSGRGVGMDVVRTNLKKINGTTEIDSQPGRGTTVRVVLPLTMAILPVLLVQVEDEIYALPLSSILQTYRVQTSAIHRLDHGEVITLEGNSTIPVVRLSEVFGVPRRGARDSGLMRIVTLAVGDRRIALVVDRLIGQESTVIKPLVSMVARSHTVAGATVSGDGQVRLVVDPAGLLDFAARRTAEVA